MNTKPTYYQQAYNRLNLVNKQPTPSQIVRTAEKNIVKNIDDEPQNKQNKQNNNIYNAYSAEVQRQNDLFKEQQKQRQARMEATIKANNAAADKSLNESYVSYMLSQKNLPQQLKAYGISGGGSETIYNDMKNSYTDSRSKIESARASANDLARQSYDSGVNSDYLNYLSAMEKVNSSYASKLNKSTPSTPTANANPLKGYSTMSVNLGKNTYTLPQLITQLSNIGMSDENIEKFLNNNGIR